jgi:hypothetical protein
LGHSFWHCWLRVLIALAEAAQLLPRLHKEAAHGGYYT